MGKQLVKGEKAVIGKIDSNLYDMTLDLTYTNLYGEAFDIDIFLFEQNTNCRVDKKNIIYYNNPESFHGINYHECFNESNSKKSFNLNLGNLPADISKLLIGCSIYKKRLDGLKSTSVEIIFRLINKTIQQEIYSYSILINPVDIESVILGDIYKHNDLWKFSAVGHSSNNNLFILLKNIYNFSIAE